MSMPSRFATNTGRKFSKEWRENLSRSHIGLEKSSSTIQKMTKARRKRADETQSQKLRDLHKDLKLMKIVKEDSVLNGLLLSDGSIPKIPKGKRNAMFALAQSIKHKELVEKTKSHLKLLGFEPHTYKYLRHDKRKNFKNSYEVIVHSSYSVVFTEMRGLWYTRKNKKRVPSYLKLDEEALAWWFMGDGSCSWQKKGEKKSTVALYTNNFSMTDVKKLKKLLEKLGLSHVNLYKSRGQPVITIQKSSEVAKFLKMVKPYVLRSFKYKIKMPVVRSRQERGQVKFSAETRQKMRMAKLGKPLSKKHRKNLSKALRGKPHSREHTRKAMLGKLKKKRQQKRRRK